jgi:hypothetical protein
MKNISINNKKNKKAENIVKKSSEVSPKNKALIAKVDNIKENSKLLKNYNIFKSYSNTIPGKIEENTKKNNYMNMINEDNININKGQNNTSHKKWIIKRNSYKIKDDNFFSYNKDTSKNAKNSITPFRIKSGSILYRSENLKMFNLKDSEKNKRKNSYFQLSQTSRPLTYDKLMNKSETYNRKSIINNNLNKIKSNIIKAKKRNKHMTIYENESEEKSSIDSYNENRKNTQFNLHKRLFINGREASNYERFCYDTLNEKLIQRDKEKEKKKDEIKIKYNQKVFSRNNQIIIPCERLKKYLTSDKETNSRILQQIINSINCSKSISTYKNQISKTNNKLIIKKIIDLNNDLNSFKYYVISDLVNKRKKFDKVINDIQKKLNPNEHNKLIIKNILYEKLSNNGNNQEKMNDEENNEKPLNSLINSFDNTNTKKFGGFVEKRFLGGLKRINKIDFKDSILKSVLDEDNYTTKQNFNKIEEEKMKKERKNLSKNTKKIKKLAKIIFNKKMNF